MTDQTQQNEPEPIEQYTPEQIAQAQSELNALSPEELLAFNSYLEALEKATQDQDFPEARVVLFTTLYSPRSGMVFHPTVRAHTMEQAFDELVRGVRYANTKFGIEPVNEYAHIYGHTLGRIQSQQQVSQQAQKQVSTTTSIPVGGDQAQQSGQQGQTKQSTGESGTDVLKKIVIMDEGFGKRVKYFVGDFKYPFADARDAETIAGMCDADTGLTVKHFEVEVGSYEPRHWGNNTLYADWEKVRVKDKTYYNVTRIHL